MSGVRDTVIGVSIAGVIVGGILFLYRDEPAAPALPATPVAAPLPKPADLVRMVKHSWDKGGFGTVGLGSFTLRNENSFTVRDITVSCDFLAPSGTKLTTARTTIYETLVPGAIRTFANVNIGFIHAQTASAACTVSGVR